MRQKLLGLFLVHSFAELGHYRRAAILLLACGGSLLELVLERCLLHRELHLDHFVVNQLHCTHVWILRKCYLSLVAARRSSLGHFVGCRAIRCEF